MRSSMFYWCQRHNSSSSKNDFPSEVWFLCFTLGSEKFNTQEDVCTVSRNNHKVLGVQMITFFIFNIIMDSRKGFSRNSFDTLVIKGTFAACLIFDNFILQKLNWTGTPFDYHLVPGLHQSCTLISSSQ